MKKLMLLGGCMWALWTAMDTAHGHLQVESGKWVDAMEARVDEVIEGGAK